MPNLYPQTKFKEELMTEIYIGLGRYVIFLDFFLSDGQSIKQNKNNKKKKYTTTQQILTLTEKRTSSTD